MVTVSYDKLFAFLYKNRITKSQLSKMSGVSRNTIIKMTKNEPVHLAAIMAICEACELDIRDVIDIDTKKNNTDKNIENKNIENKK